MNMLGCVLRTGNVDGVPLHNLLREERVSWNPEHMAQTMPGRRVRFTLRERSHESAPYRNNGHGTNNVQFRVFRGQVPGNVCLPACQRRKNRLRMMLSTMLIKIIEVIGMNTVPCVPFPADIAGQVSEPAEQAGRVAEYQAQHDQQHANGNQQLAGAHRVSP